MSAKTETGTSLSDIMTTEREWTINEQCRSAESRVYIELILVLHTNKLFFQQNT